jgi:hypothetical protein
VKWNSTNGSWWIVQIPSNSKDPNYPPTSVDGISSGWVLAYRKDPNEPPTAVGGISDFLRKAISAAQFHTQQIRILFATK